MQKAQKKAIGKSEQGCIHDERKHALIESSRLKKGRNSVRKVSKKREKKREERVRKGRKKHEKGVRNERKK